MVNRTGPIWFRLAVAVPDKILSRFQTKFLALLGRGLFLPGWYHHPPTPTYTTVVASAAVSLT